MTWPWSITRFSVRGVTHPGSPSAVPSPAPPEPPASPSPPAVPVRSLRLISVTLAIACGAAVANLYYAQPLLVLIADSFDVSSSTATFVVTATQIGYALGLALLLPLGDLLENRRLVTRTLVLTALALTGAAFAPNLGVFLAASVLIGVTSVVAQILVPLAAHLAPPAIRGQFVGQVMSGLILGILLARSAASLAAAAWGWRSIYLVSAGLMLVTALALLKVLPRRRPDSTARYGALLVSVITLARTEPILRRRALAQAFLFGSFTAYWTAISFELVDSHHLSQTGIAVFALVGAGGAAAAPLAGRLGDRGHGPAGRLGALVLAVVASALAGFGASNLVLLALAGVIVDFAVQGHQVLSLRDIYALREDARARINAVYMTSVFTGGALASAITGAVHQRWGWSGVTAFAAVLPVVSFLFWLDGRRREH